MIEISHKQAQRLIREEQDRRIPEEQWAMLQTHLESCAECCTYRQHLASYERGLHRTLQTRWSWVRGPGAGISERVVGIKTQRKNLAQLIRKASMYIFVVLLIAGYFTYRRVTAPPPPIIPTPERISVAAGTPSPDPLQTSFHDLVMFESRREGNAEIYLLSQSSSGPQLTNLTQSPAQDTNPSWSPDGEWIAFLSDRSGKNEVYVTHIAGSRLTQVTNAPQIEWVGPIEWSYDGKWLGLAGRSGGPKGSLFLYLIPLNQSSEPLSIANTYNADVRFRFSPDQPALAYLTGQRAGGIDVANVENGWTGPLTLEDNQTLQLSAGTGAAFDWSLDGRSLVYVADPMSQEPGRAADGTGSQIRLSPEIKISDPQNFPRTGAKTVDSLPAPNRFRAVSWVPHSLLVASLVGDPTNHGEQKGCWTVRLSNPYDQSQTPRMLPELCVEGGLRQSNWTPDGQWLVLIARKPEEQSPALYALRIPDPTGGEDTSGEKTISGASPDMVRLADIPEEDLPPTETISENSLYLEPKVRPAGQMLRFTPRAALPVEPVPAPAALPWDLPGWIIYSTQQGGASWIARVRPNGKDHLLLTRTDREHTCPRISPDGRQVAYLSDEDSIQRGVNEVYVMGLDGKNRIQLTRNSFPGADVLYSNVRPLPRFNCPAWSPDGKYLAAALRDDDRFYLAILPVNGKTPAKFFQVRHVSERDVPLWMPRNPQNPASGPGDLLLANPWSAEIVRINVGASVDRPAAQFKSFLPISNWDVVRSMSFSPDGTQLAVIYVNQSALERASRQGGMESSLYTVDLASRFLPSQQNGVISSTWLSDNQIGLVSVDSLIGPRKSIFEIFDPRTKNGTRLAGFEEIVDQAKWLQGRWVVFSSESGLWIMDIEQARENKASPVKLRTEPVLDFDWR